MRESLPAERVATLLREARDEGYAVASFSGGEPLVYAQLPELLLEAKRLGLGTSLVTNGMLHPGRWAGLADRLDLLAVSLDGPPAIHDRMRGAPGAFARMAANLPAIRASGIRFGLIHTVSAETLPHLDWLADFAVEAGAALLQLHPLGLVGAGADLLELGLDGEAMTRIYLTGLALGAKHSGALAVHVDLFNRELVEARPSLIHAAPPGRAARGPLAGLVNPLVVMADGELSPVCHALHPDYRLGNVLQQPLGELAEAWRAGGARRFRGLCRRLWAELLPRLEWPYFNWYETLETGSYRRAG